MVSFRSIVSRDGIYEFIPDLPNEKYQSDDEKLAKRTDFRNLDVIVTIKAPLLAQSGFIRNHLRIQ